MRLALHSRTRGFTLLEVMITVVIVGILAAIALPSYNYFVTRSRITEATTSLGDMRSAMEKYFMDNRTYLSGTKCGIEAAAIDLMTKHNGDPSAKFQADCKAVTATTYTLRMTGQGPMNGFTYEVNEQNVKVSAALPTGWSTPSPNTCWAIRKDGSCS